MTGTPSLPAYVADTHTLLWLWSNPDLLGTDAVSALSAVADGKARLLVPTVVLIELQVKEDKGGHAAGTTAGARAFSLETPGLELAALDLPVVDQFAKVPRTSIKDPFDRLIIATALANGASLMSKDSKISAWGGVPIVW